MKGIDKEGSDYTMCQGYEPRPGGVAQSKLITEGKNGKQNHQ